MASWAWALLAGLVAALPRRDPVAVRLRHLADRIGADPRRTVPRAVVGRRVTAIVQSVVSGRRARLIPAGLGVGSAGVAAASSGRILVGVAAGLSVGAGVAAAGRMGQARLIRTQRRQLRLALTLLDAELSAGARENDALRAASQVAGPGDDCLHQAASVADRGGDVAAVFAAAGPRFVPLAAVWQVRTRCGAALAEVVGKLERDLADGDARWRDVEAALAGPRASAALLATLPLVGLGLGSALGAHPLGWLVGTSAGSVLLAVGVVFDLAGLFWMQRLIRLGRSPAAR